MSMQSYGSVVAMEFRARPSIDFADIVEEFDIAFQMVDSQKRSLTWESDHVAIIERDYVRVALGWLPGERKRRPWHLIIAVGSAPGEDLTKIEMSSYEFVADRILERTKDYLPSTAVMRGDASQPVGPALIGTIFDLLGPDSQTMASDQQAQRRQTPMPDHDNMSDYSDMVHSMSPPWDYADTDNIRCDRTARHMAGHAHRTKKPDPEIGCAQQILPHSETSKPMRLTIHTLALSLCLYVPPLGAAMFAYSMMRDVFPMAAQAI